MKKIFIFTAFLFYLIPSLFCNSVYFVDATGGDDSNSGLSETKAWKTINKINNYKFSPGDRIQFKRNEIWRGQLFVSSSGTMNLPIVFGAYGSGEDPIINGAEIVPTWFLHHGTIYSRMLTDWEPGILCEDDRPLDWLEWKNNAYTTFQNEERGTYAWDPINKIMYIWCSDGKNPSEHVIEVSKSENCITARDRNYIQIENITCEKSSRHGIFTWNAGNIFISNCTIRNLGGRNTIGNGVEFANESYACKIEDCKIYNIFDAGISVQIFSETQEVYNISDIAIENCEVSFCGLNCIEVAIFGKNSIISNVSILKCNLKNSGKGWSGIQENDAQGIDIEVGTYSSNCRIEGIKIERCNIHHNLKEGIYLQKEIGDVTISKSKIFNNGTYGIYAKDLTNPSTSVLSFYYNLCYGNSQDGLYIDIPEGDGLVLYNNVFFDNGKDPSFKNVRVQALRSRNKRIINNIFYGKDTVSYFDESGANFNYSQDSNIFYRKSGIVIHHNGTDYTSDQFGTYQAESGQDFNSYNINPLFVDSEANNFLLRFNSCAIDSGLDVGLNSDFLGRSVPIGQAVDIGAYEMDISPIALNTDVFPKSGLIPLHVSFFAEVSGGIPPYRFHWDFGDISYSTSQNPTHTYTQAGEFEVNLNVIDSQNQQASSHSIINSYSNTSEVTLNISIKTGQPNPGPGGSTDPTPGIYSLLYGSQVYTTAIPKTNYRFSRWDGDVLDTDKYEKEISSVMDRNKSVTAIFYTRCGDVNGDLAITPLDAQLTFEIFLGLIPGATNGQYENADVNCDGTRKNPFVSPADAQAIFMKFLGESELPSDCFASSRKTEVSYQENAKSLTHEKDIQEVNILISDINCDVGEIIAVPIIIDHPAELDSFGFDLAFPSDVLKYIGVEKTELTTDFYQVDGNEIQHGILRVGGYSRVPISEESPGELVNILFRTKKETSYPNSFFLIDTFDDIKKAVLHKGIINIIRTHTKKSKNKKNIRKTCS